MSVSSSQRFQSESLQFDVCFKIERGKDIVLVSLNSGESEWGGRSLCVKRFWHAYPPGWNFGGWIDHIWGNSVFLKCIKNIFFWLCCMACGILVPRLGIEPVPPRQQHGVLTTGPPGKSRGNAVLSGLKVMLLNLCLSSSACSWKWWAAEAKMTKEKIRGTGDLTKPWTWKMKRWALFEIASPGPTSVPELSDRIVAHTLFFILKGKTLIVLETRNSP